MIVIRTPDSEHPQCIPIVTPAGIGTQMNACDTAKMKLYDRLKSRRRLLLSATFWHQDTPGPSLDLNKGGPYISSQVVPARLTMEGMFVAS